MAKSNGADLGKELIKFYEKKAQTDHGGGKFFKVIHLGRPQQTIWAKSSKDLIALLRAAKIPYDKLIPLT